MVTAVLRQQVVQWSTCWCKQQVADGDPHHSSSRGGIPPLSSHGPRGPVQPYYRLGGGQSSYVRIPLEDQRDQGSSADPQDRAPHD